MRPLGYELTGDSLPHCDRSHTSRSLVGRPACSAASRLFASISACSVPKSVPNTATGSKCRLPGAGMLPRRPHPRIGPVAHSMHRQALKHNAVDGTVGRVDNELPRPSLASRPVPIVPVVPHSPDAGASPNNRRAPPSAWPTSASSVSSDMHRSITHQRANQPPPAASSGQ